MFKTKICQKIKYIFKVEKIESLPAKIVAHKNNHFVVLVKIIFSFFCMVVNERYYIFCVKTYTVLVAPIKRR